MTKKTFRLLLGPLLLQAVFACRLAAELPEVARTVNEGCGQSFSFDGQAYRGDLNKLPIGVFDSGIGGLTVLSTLLTLDLFDNHSGAESPDGVPDFDRERFVYLGDQANMPYGDYPAAGRTELLRELIIKDAVFLLGTRYWPGREASSPRSDKPPVKAIVVACNTATAYGIEDLREAVELWGIPLYVVGVVEAGARGALEAVGQSGNVAVMATEGTCSSLAYVRAVERAWSEAGLAAPMVIQQGCLGLAGAIEGQRDYISTAESGLNPAYHGPSPSNSAARIDTLIFERYGFEPEGLLGLSLASVQLNSVDNYIRYHTTTLVDRYSFENDGRPLAVVILGCTHFPFFSRSLAAAFDRLRNLEVVEDCCPEKPYAGLIAAGLVLVDPARNTAVELYRELRRRGILLAEGVRCLIDTDEFYISVTSPATSPENLDADGGFTYEFKYGRPAGNPDLEDVRRVPLTAASLKGQAREMIREKMPVVWQRLVEFNRGSPRLTRVPRIR